MSVLLLLGVHNLVRKIDGCLGKGTATHACKDDWDQRRRNAALQ